MTTTSEKLKQGKWCSGSKISIFQKINPMTLVQEVVGDIDCSLMIFCAPRKRQVELQTFLRWNDKINGGEASWMVFLGIYFHLFSSFIQTKTNRNITLTWIHYRIPYRCVYQTDPILFQIIMSRMNCYVKEIKNANVVKISSWISSE